jgi:hypothetical protein
MARLQRQVGRQLAPAQAAPGRWSQQQLLRRAPWLLLRVAQQLLHQRRQVG